MEKRRDYPYIAFLGIIFARTMGKIIVLQHSNQLGLGGTEKTMQIFCKYLDRSVFEVHALTQRFPVPLQRVARLAVRNLITGGSGSSFQPHRFCHSRLP